MIICYLNGMSYICMYMFPARLTYLCVIFIYLCTSLLYSNYTYFLELCFCAMLVTIFWLIGLLSFHREYFYLGWGSTVTPYVLPIVSPSSLYVIIIFHAHIKVCTFITYIPEILIQFIFLDMDECSVDNGVCFAHSSCVNTYGTFHCVCHIGYTMLPNGKQCSGTSM